MTITVVAIEAPTILSRSHAPAAWAPYSDFLQTQYNGTVNHVQGSCKTFRGHTADNDINTA